MNATKVTGISVKAITFTVPTRSGVRRDRAGVSSFFKRLSSRRVRRLAVSEHESSAQQAALAAWDEAQEWQRAEDTDWVAKVRASYRLDPITGEGEVEDAIELMRDYAHGTFVFGTTWQEFPIIYQELELEVFRCSKFGIGESSDGTGWWWLFHAIRRMWLAPYNYNCAMQALRAAQGARYNSYWNE